MRARDSSPMRRSVLAAAVCLLFAPGAPRAAEPPAQNEWLDMVQRVQARVERVRGLAFKRPVKAELASVERVRAYLQQVIAEQYAPGELEREGLAMQALGLFPAGLDYRTFLLELLQEQVGGFYDPKAEVLYLADWMPAASQESVMAHELAHALQDQHFDLDRFQTRQAGRADAMLARSAVAEGEATLLMMLDATRELGLELDPAMLSLEGPLADLLFGLTAAQYPAMARAPRAVRETLMFPYLHGLAFVSAIRARGGFEAIGRLYADLPESSEQILHPERYFQARDAPTWVSLAALDGLAPEGWEMVFEEQLGEFMTRQLLQTALADRDEVARATDGWDGDLVRVYRRGGELGWLGLWVCDSDAHAIALAGALARLVMARRPAADLEPLSAATELGWRWPDGRVSRVLRRGPRVLALDGLPFEAAGRLQAAGLRQP